MAGAHPELPAAHGVLRRTVDVEDENFRRTMDRGMKLLDEASGKLPQGATLPGETVFKLYDTYGFPADLTRVIAEERGFTVDEAGFEAEMAKQRARSEEFAGSGEKAVADVYKELRVKHGATEFLGYNHTQAEGHIQAVLRQGDKIEIVADRTPFYGESGGQVGDTGTIQGADFAITVEDTLKPGGDLIVTTPNVARLDNVRKIIAGHNVYDPYSGHGPYGRHNREYTQEDLFDLLSSNGFSIRTMFTADVNSGPKSDVPLNAIAHLVKQRQTDLGQYIFCRCSVNHESKGITAQRPEWLYRGTSTTET